MSTRCCGLVGLLFGHDFVSRKDIHRVEPWRPREWAEFSGPMPEANVYDETYRGDVCRRCGVVVNAPVNPPALKIVE